MSMKHEPGRAEPHDPESAAAIDRLMAGSASLEHDVRELVHQRGITAVEAGNFGRMFLLMETRLRAEEQLGTADPSSITGADGEQ
jgi:hypothetical protein